MQGGSTPQDLETMFQLLYLRFTQPRTDPAAFAALAAQAKALLANQNASPDIVFNRTIEEALSNYHPRRGAETPTTIDRWILRRRLRSTRRASPMRATSRSCSSAASAGRHQTAHRDVRGQPAGEHARDVARHRHHAATGKIEKKINLGIAPKSSVAIVLSGSFDYDPSQAEDADGELLLQSRLFDTIRQDLGGTYSITATIDSQKLPRPQYAVRIEWTCDPARTDSLVQRVWQEIEYVRDLRLSAQQLMLVRESLVREFERSSQDNGYLLSAIARDYQDNGAQNLGDIEHVPDQIAALTSAAIRDAAQTYLKADNSVTVIQSPERR